MSATTLALVLPLVQGPFRMTLDVARAEVTNRREFELAVGGYVIDTTGVRLLRNGPDVALRAVSEVSTEFDHGRRFAVANAGSPADFAVTTQIPYATRTTNLSRHLSFTTTEVGSTEVGSILRVTAWPAGAGQVQVRIEASESRAGDRIYLDPPGPPSVQENRISTTVTVPIGSTLYLGGSPSTSSSTRRRGGVEPREAFLHFLFGGETSEESSTENLMLLTVTEERSLDAFGADDLIRQMRRRLRDDFER